MSQSRIHLFYKFDDDHMDTAEVWIDGHVNGLEHKFILDTGCATTSLFYNDFSSQFPSRGEREYSSAFGKAMSDYIQIESIGAGPIQEKQIQIARTRDGGNDKNLFGMDLLKNSILHFLPKDNAVDVLSVRPENIDLKDLYLDSGSIPFVEIDFLDKKAIAVWDTGAGITIVDSKFFNDHRNLFDSGGKTTGTDSAGHTFETEIFLMKPINIGGYKFPAHRIVPLNLNHIGHKTGRGMDFILGYSTLMHANWLMDFPNRKWAITQTHF